MRPDEIKGHLHRLPFEPIRVFVSDGSSFDVRHPDFMFVTRTEVVIASKAGPNAYIDPLHVTRIEPIKGRPGRAVRRTRIR